MSTAYPPTPSPVPPAPPQKKTSPWVWVLGGCGILIVIAVLVLVVGGLFVAHKVKQAGFDPDLMKKNPALAAAKMMAAVNPNAEVVSVDESRGLITVRDKKTGKTVTMNFEDIKNGKMSFKDEKGEELSIQGEGESGRFSMKTKEGEVNFGGKWTQPGWLPSYPGVTITGTVASKGGQESSGTGSFTTNRSLDQILDFYESGLKGQGLDVERTITTAGGSGKMGILTAHDSGSKRQATVHAMTEGGENRVTVTFSSKN
jgi:hypothetical protein